MNEEQKDEKMLEILLLDIITTKEIVINALKEKGEDCSEFAINNRVREFKAKVLSKSSVNEIKRIAKSKEEIIRNQIDE